MSTIDRERGQPGSPAGLNRSGSKKITRRLLALGTASIIAVYAAGLAGSTVAASQASVPVVSGATDPVSTASTTTSPARPAVTGQYRDGTYIGIGSSRHGDIQVQVVVQGGKIASAGITQASTRYPVSRIASLPGLVVSEQSANVDIVSGATDSSTAYLAAVANALAQAA
jgi:uncharacterized protein with FMN-binding domain